jgi:hypothetical protein
MNVTFLFPAILVAIDLKVMEKMAQRITLTGLEHSLDVGDKYYDWDGIPYKVIAKYGVKLQTYILERI